MGLWRGASPRLQRPLLKRKVCKPRWNIKAQSGLRPRGFFCGRFVCRMQKAVSAIGLRTRKFTAISARKRRRRAMCMIGFPPQRTPTPVWKPITGPLWKKKAVRLSARSLSMGSVTAMVGVSWIGSSAQRFGATVTPQKRQRRWSAISLTRWASTGCRQNAVQKTPPLSGSCKKSAWPKKVSCADIFLPETAALTMSWSMGCFPKQKSKHHCLTSLFGSYLPRRHSRRGVFVASEGKAPGAALPPGIRSHGCTRGAPLARRHPAARHGGVAGERHEPGDRPAAIFEHREGSVWPDELVTNLVHRKMELSHTSTWPPRLTIPLCTQKNRRTGFPIRRQTVYLPNKSLCDPVRASVSTSTSSSIR